MAEHVALIINDMFLSGFDKFRSPHQSAIVRGGDSSCQNLAIPRDSSNRIVNPVNI